MSAQKAGPDPARSRMRTTVAAIEREIERIKKQGKSTDGKDVLADFAGPWAELVAQLALGPEPEVRECPTCKSVGIREATLCGFCWTKLVPPPRKAAAE